MQHCQWPGALNGDEGVRPPGISFIGGELTRPQIASLYRHALGFDFPSLNEGFGMPILEAMASGCAVITSRNTACSEVAGDAALLVDPRSAPSIAEAMRQLWQDEGLCTWLGQRGLERSSAFNWAAASARHAEVFRGAVNCNGQVKPDTKFKVFEKSANLTA